MDRPNGDSNVNVRYYWPKEIDHFPSRTNATTNTWFSQWVRPIKGTTPSSVDTVACLRDFFLDRSSAPELFCYGVYFSTRFFGSTFDLR
jgi:hypothetical protein